MSSCEDVMDQITRVACVCRNPGFSEMSLSHVKLFLTLTYSEIISMTRNDRGPYTFQRLFQLSGPSLKA